MQDDTDWIATTVENCHAVAGPFYHGTAAQLTAGDLLVPGFASNYQKGRISNHVYFSSTVASLAAQIAVALTGARGRGHVYVVEPTGPFEDDPNVTNKRFRGNPTKSYRSRHPLRILQEVDDWEEQSPEIIDANARPPRCSEGPGPGPHRGLAARHRPSPDERAMPTAVRRRGSGTRDTRPLEPHSVAPCRNAARLPSAGRPMIFGGDASPYG